MLPVPPPKDRGSRPEVFCKKGVLRNFGKFTGKHLCQSLFLIKLQASGQSFFFNKVVYEIKETLAQVFSYEFCESFKNTFFTEHPWATASVNKKTGNNNTK